MSDLACWERALQPILRDPYENSSFEYETASDGHVFLDGSDTLRMVYSGDVEGHSSIKLATGTDWDTWERSSALLAGEGPAGMLDRQRETAFYRVANDGTHQIFYIGYTDSETYQSQIFMAEADDLEGPWRLPEAPIVPRGTQAGRDVYLITSPSVVEHEGVLHMTYLGWNASKEEVTAVWVFGATSTDDGRTWGNIEEVDVPVGMEGQLTKGPDGRFYAVSSADTEGIRLARAERPFGPYESLPGPVVVNEGPPWEVHESTAPMLVFEEETRTAHLFYTGADYAKGWWMMRAQTGY